MVRSWRERGRPDPTRINWNPHCSLNRVQASSFHHVADSQEKLEPLVKKVTQEVTEAEENSAGAATGAGLAATSPCQQEKKRQEIYVHTRELQQCLYCSPELMLGCIRFHFPNLMQIVFRVNPNPEEIPEIVVPAQLHLTRHTLPQQVSFIQKCSSLFSS